MKNLILIIGVLFTASSCATQKRKTCDEVYIIHRVPYIDTVTIPTTHLHIDEEHKCMYIETWELIINDTLELKYYEPTCDKRKKKCD